MSSPEGPWALALGAGTLGCAVALVAVYGWPAELIGSGTPVGAGLAALEVADAGLAAIGLGLTVAGARGHADGEA